MHEPMPPHVLGSKRQNWPKAHSVSFMHGRKPADKKEWVNEFEKVFFFNLVSIERA
jgi:hypothetical protein